MAEAPLEIRFRRHLGALGLGEKPLRLLVAVSGGLDSTVLLHLLRFRSGESGVELTAAHFDHRMRPSSGADAVWTRGLCAAWQVPLESGSAAGPLGNETAAREARYAFLRAAAVRCGATRIATAHHADDQAETVLFRILRGTGIAGLAGIPVQTRSGLLRPLLPFWREELEEYARENGLAWRLDPTNASHGPARNRIRLRLLPEIEREITAAARRNLVALAAHARESEAGWRAVLSSVFPRITSHEEGAILIARSQLRELHPAIGTRVVREALRQFQISLGGSGTRSALTFITDAASGRVLQLPKAVQIQIEFDRARIETSRALPDDTRLQIDTLEPGRGFDSIVRLGGKRWRVSAQVVAEPLPVAPGARWQARFPLTTVRFPLGVRGRLPGDRVHTTGGTKSLKKLMIEQRVPASDRARRPVLVDAQGAILWVAGFVPVQQRPFPPGEWVLDVAITGA